MNKKNYKAVKLMMKIAFEAWKISQGSSVGVNFEYSPFIDNFSIKIYPKINVNGDYQLDTDNSYYIDGNGEEIRGVYTPVKITKENCLTILEKLKEY